VNGAENIFKIHHGNAEEKQSFLMTRLPLGLGRALLMYLYYKRNRVAWAIEKE